VPRGPPCPSRRRRPAPLRDSQPGDGLAFAQTLAVVREETGEHAAERTPDGSGHAGAFDHADSLAVVDALPTDGVVPEQRAEHTYRGCHDDPLRHRQTLALDECNLHGHPTSVSAGRSPGVATPETGTSGTVRLASAASIVPCPTSRQRVVPMPAIVSIEVHHRTGSVTGTPSRDRQPSPTVLGDASRLAT